MKLFTGHIVYIRYIGMKIEEAREVLNRFTFEGAIPEPLRISRLLARSIVKSLDASM